MLVWIKANTYTIIGCIVIIAIVVLIIRKLITDKKRGKSTCGCDCSHCSADCMNTNHNDKNSRSK